MTEKRQQINQSSKLGTAFFSLVLFLLSLAIAFYVHYSQMDVLQQLLKGQADRTEVKIISNTQDLLADLNSMSKRWVNNNKTSEANWRADARDFIDRIDGVDSIWWVDAELVNQWRESNDINHISRGPELMEDSNVVLKLIKARENNTAEISKTYNFDGQNVVFIFHPIGQGEHHDGFLAIEVHVDEFIDDLLGDPLSTGYYTKAYAGKDVVFANGPQLKNHSYLEHFELNLDADNEGWIFKVYPTENALDMIVSPLPYFIAVAGGIISLLFMLTLWSKQKAKNQSKILANEISEKEKVQFELEYLANHDTLTHLPNRHYITNFIEKRVKLSQANNQKFTILFIDLDHFKDINDTLGHAVGDEMLKKLPVLFNRVFRHDDVIARMGGDEFVVYLPGQLSIEHVTKLVERFLKSLEYPIQIDEHLIRLTGSVGVAFFPQHGSNVTELLSHADAALYRAKDKGRNTYAVYDSEIEQKAKDRIQLISRLHIANENNEFEMYFQPRYNLSDNRVVGAEALIRWKPSEHETVEPASFIELLEETSLIIPVSWRMLKLSCQQFVKLTGPDSGIFMSFNVSAKQLEHPDFLHNLKSTLTATQFPPQKLELELTEQTVIQNVENSQYILNEVSKMGIAIAIDDFGTGYSNYSHVMKLDVDYLKIDGSLIKNIHTDKNSQIAVSNIVKFAQEMDVKTIAEYVHSKDVFQVVNNIGVDYSQGYYIGKPQSSLDVSEKLPHQVGYK